MHELRVGIVIDAPIAHAQPRGWSPLSEEGEKITRAATEIGFCCPRDNVDASFSTASALTEMGSRPL